jgi:CubicO group peptidase (beta-lactamase class C family)
MMRADLHPLLSVSIYVCLMLLAGCGYGSAQDVPPADQPLPADEQGLIKRFVLPLPTQVQVAIAIVEGDEVRFVGVERSASGLRSLDNRDAVFEIGSITKVFTATLLAQQVRKGSLSLDDPVQRLLPIKLKAPARGGAELTLKHLVSHTSGMCHQPPGLNFHALMHGHPGEPFKDYDVNRFEKYLKKKMKLDFTPGQQYQYSNMGMSLVGYILSRHTDKSYEELLHEAVFAPLGMSSSSTELDKVVAQVVTGVEKHGVPAPNWDMYALASAGGIKTSAEDFARFAMAQLDPDSAIAMTQKPIFTIEDGYHVGMGWHIIDRDDGERWLNHGGGMAGYTAIVDINVKRQLAVIVLSNLGNAHELAENVSRLGHELMKRLESLPTQQAPDFGAYP